MTPAHSSKTRIVEQKSSSPQPLAMAARSICSVSAVDGRGTSILLADSRARPMSLVIHLVESRASKSTRKDIGSLEGDQTALCGAIVQNLQHELGRNTALGSQDHSFRKSLH